MALVLGLVWRGRCGWELRLLETNGVSTLVVVVVLLRVEGRLHGEMVGSSYEGSHRLCLLRFRQITFGALVALICP